jgi:hypothetical protein
MKDLIIETISQDMGVAIAALKGDEFVLVNILGNRIATNLMVGNRNELIMIGFLLKEIPGELGRIGDVNDRKLPECKNRGIEFIKNLQKLLNKDEVDIGGIWKEYENYEKDIKKYLLTKSEASIYKESQNFTKETRLMLLQHLNQNKVLLLRERNDLIDGVIREFSRVINTHGFYPEDLVFYLLMKAFGSYYNYFIYDYFGGEETDKKEKKREINSYVEKIHELFSAENKLDDIYEQSADMIGELGVKWRKYFINYGEFRLLLRAEGGAEIPRIEIPEEAKKKIGEVITEGLKKEVEKV